MSEASGGDEPSTMIIRVPEWTPIEIPIRWEGASNYLGGKYDLDYSGATAKAEMIKVTKASCAAIKATKASTATKLMVSRLA